MTDHKIKTKTPKRSKGRPFKKFPCDQPGLFLLPPIAFKIWLYHFARESADRKSWPAVKTVMTACDIGSRRIFYERRRYLIENGWLVKVGEMPTKTKGGQPVPIFRTTIGTIPSKAHKVNPTKGSQSDTNRARLGSQSDTNLVPQSDPNRVQKVILEVDSSEVEPDEVKNKTLNPEVDGSGKGGSGSSIESGSTAIKGWKPGMTRRRVS